MKQTPAQEFVVTDDVLPTKAPHHMTPGMTPKFVPVENQLPSSVWEQWLATQKGQAAQAKDPQTDESARREGKTGSPPGQFDSRLATGSGFTNTGPAATKARLAAMEDAKKKEENEVEELKQLLSRTLYTGGGNSYIRAGQPATSGLRKLPDGQNDSIAELFRRRKGEEDAAAVATGRPGWDSSQYRYIPPALKGCKPVTPEPWAKDEANYVAGLEGHGFKANEQNQIARKKQVSYHANVAKTIEADMRAYRKELGTGRQTPMSARHYRAWSDAGSLPSTARSASRGSPHPRPSPTRAPLSDRAQTRLGWRRRAAKRGMFVSCPGRPAEWPPERPCAQCAACRPQAISAVGAPEPLRSRRDIASRAPTESRTAYARSKRCIAEARISRGISCPCRLVRGFPCMCVLCTQRSSVHVR